MWARVRPYNQPPSSWWPHRTKLSFLFCCRFSGGSAHPGTQAERAVSILNTAGHRAGGEESLRVSCQPRSDLCHSCPCSSLARTDLPQCQGPRESDPAVPRVGGTGKVWWLSLVVPAWLLPFPWICPQLWSGDLQMSSLP